MTGIERADHAAANRAISSTTESPQGHPHDTGKEKAAPQAPGILQWLQDLPDSLRETAGTGVRRSSIGIRYRSTTEGEFVPELVSLRPTEPGERAATGQVSSDSVSGGAGFIAADVSNLGWANHASMLRRMGHPDLSDPSAGRAASDEAAPAAKQPTED